MKIIQVKTHKLYIIRKRSNNKVSFVKFTLNSRQFKLMTTGFQPHGARWPRFNCTDDWDSEWAYGKKVVLSFRTSWHAPTFWQQVAPTVPSRKNASGVMQLLYDDDWASVDEMMFASSVESALAPCSWTAIGVARCKDRSLRAHRFSSRWSLNPIKPTYDRRHSDGRLGFQPAYYGWHYTGRPS